MNMCLWLKEKTQIPRFMGIIYLFFLKILFIYKDVFVCPGGSWERFTILRLKWFLFHSPFPNKVRNWSRLLERWIINLKNYCN